MARRATHNRARGRGAMKEANNRSEHTNSGSRGGARGKVLKGAVAGAVLGAATAVLLASPAGQKLRRNLSARAADFYRYIAPQLRKLRNMSRDEYEAFIDQAVKRYGKLKKLSAPEILKLAKEAKRVWGEISSYLK